MYVQATQVWIQYVAVDATLFIKHLNRLTLSNRAVNNVLVECPPYSIVAWVFKTADLVY